MGISYSELTLHEPSVEADALHDQAKAFCEERFSTWTLSDVQAVLEYVKAKKDSNFNIKWTEFFDAMEFVESQRRIVELKKQRLQWHPSTWKYSMKIEEKEMPFIMVEESPPVEPPLEPVVEEEAEELYESTDEDLSEDDGTDNEGQRSVKEMKRRAERPKPPGEEGEEAPAAADAIPPAATSAPGSETQVEAPAACTPAAEAKDTPPTDPSVTGEASTETDQVKTEPYPVKIKRTFADLEEAPQEQEGKAEEKEEGKKGEESKDTAPKDAVPPAPTAAGTTLPQLASTPLIAENQFIPPLWDPTLICPTFFGRSLETVSEQESHIMEEKMKAMKDLEDYNEARRKADRANMDELLQKVASRQKTRAKLTETKLKKREKALKTRNEELTAAKDALSPSEYKVYKGSWAKNERDVKAQEDKEDQELKKTATIAEATDQKMLDEAQKEWEKISQEDEMMFYKPRGLVLQLRAEKAYKAKKLEMQKQQKVLKDFELELQVVKENKSASRGMVILAEGSVKKAAKDLEEMQASTKSEEMALERAAEIRKIEEPYIPLFRTLLIDKNAAIEEINYLELLVSVIIYTRDDIQAKVKLIFELFDLDKNQQLTMDEVTILLQCAVNVLSKFGGVTRQMSVAELESMVQQAITASDLDGNDTISKSELILYASREINLNRNLATLFRTSWKYDSYSTFQTSAMSIVQLYNTGFISLREMQHRAAGQKVRVVPELDKENKSLCHERALAMGHEDPLKPDYTRFLPKRSINDKTHVKVLAHGAYKNIEEHISETLHRAAMKLQSNFRGYLGREASVFEKTMMQFYEKERVAKERVKDAVAIEFKDNEMSSGITKVKWNAKIRMKQVKMRAANKSAERENALDDLMQEEIALRIADVEAQYKKLAAEQGFFRDKNLTAEEAFLKHKQWKYEMRGINLDAKMREGETKRKAEVKTITTLKDQMAKNKKPPETQWDILEKKRQKTSEGGTFGIRVKRKDESERLALMESMCVAPNLYPLPRSDFEDKHLYEYVGDPNPSYQRLYNWLLSLNKYVTPYKAKELLKELPSKQLMIQRVNALHTFGNLTKHLADHFRFPLVSVNTLAIIFRGLVRLDYDNGVSEDLVDQFISNYYATLTLLVRSQTAKTFKTIKTLADRRAQAPNWTPELAAALEEKQMYDEEVDIMLLQKNLEKAEEKFNKAKEVFEEQKRNIATKTQAQLPIMLERSMNVQE